MKWIKISISTTSESTDLVSDLMFQQGIDGVSVLDKEDIYKMSQQLEGSWDMIDSKLADNMPKQALVEAWLPVDIDIKDRLLSLSLSLKRLKEKATIDMGSLDIKKDTVDDVDWLNQWKKHYKPFKPGETIVIKPSWENYKAKDREKILNLDPGMAFGTGRHETTYMCITLMEEAFRLKDIKKVLDLGTGSGILAIGSALMGAEKIWGTDIDLDAIRIAKKNVAINDFENKIKILKKDLLKEGFLKEKSFELIMANIVADAIINLATPLKAYMNKKAYFISSGILKQREDEVIKRLEAEGYELVRLINRGEWSGMLWKWEDK